MAKLVGRSLVKVGSGEGPLGPELVVVEVSVAAKDGEERMCKSLALAVEWIAVAVLPLLEPDVDVDLAAALLEEGEVGGLGPDVECAADFGVDVSLAQPSGRRVAADLVAQVSFLPSAT